MIDYKLSSSGHDVVDYIFNELSMHLHSGESVLWLSSGGSNIEITVDIANQLKQVDTTNLYFSLVDERYGTVSHKDENWQQLIDSGFELPQANLYRPLISQPIDETTKHFSEWLNERLNQVDYRLGLFGIGSDGHTAGIKAGSDAVSSNLLVAHYNWDDFERITITPVAIKKLDEIVTRAIGTDKYPTIKQLIESDLPVGTQPAQVLKLAKKSILFTDYKKEVNQ